MRILIVALAAASLSLAAYATEPAKPSGTLIDLTAEASRSAPNDLARATAFVEAAEASPADVAKRVNAAIATALQTAKSAPAVKVRSGNTTTYPVNAKGSSRIEAWRMRSELLLEARDTQALSELLGRLQSTLAIGQISLSPAPETRRKAEDEAMVEAIAAFRAKAKVVADVLGKPYRIRQLSIGGGARPGPYPVMRATMAEAAPPIEAGESSVSISVSGQIELVGTE